MAYKDLLVCLDPTLASDERVKLAVALAKAHGARLLGLDVSSDAAFNPPWRERALQIGRVFEEMTAAAGLKSRLIGADYREGGPSPDLTHCVDLIIAPRPQNFTRELVASFVPGEFLLKSGAPTLIVPDDWTYQLIGRKIVIAWNASREATRAVHDAMPFLEAADKVVVFSFSHGPSELRADAEALLTHLAHHNVVATLADWTNTGDIGAVEALFASLDTQNCDMIVAGGFGHSRFFEGLFGGVSMDLINQPVLPALLSH
jgi:nucleotide-binding universal stress UspA family protein